MPSQTIEREPATTERHSTVGTTLLVNVDDLLVGSKLRLPICDRHGILLLGVGHVITTKFKELLNQRGVTQVIVSRQDLQHVTRLRRPAAPLVASDVGESRTVTEARSSTVTPRATSARLARLLTAPNAPIRNSGPAARSGQQQLGVQPYLPEKREQLVQAHLAASDLLGDMLHDALGGCAHKSGEIETLAETYLAELLRDPDCMLSVTCGSVGEDSLQEHCLRMASLGMAIGIEMGLNAENVKHIGKAGMLHDWGMSRVPIEIREARRRLTKPELEEVQRHPLHTLELINRIAHLPDVVAVAMHQIHERPNGSGYPHGRTGESIHIFARILQVADSYLALTASRPHRPPLTPYGAMECLLRQAHERLVDPSCVRSLLRVMSLFPVGSHVQLSDGSRALVLRHNPVNYMLPIVQICDGREPGSSTIADPASIIDLSRSQLRVVRALPNAERGEVGLNSQILQNFVPAKANSAASLFGARDNAQEAASRLGNFGAQQSAGQRADHDLRAIEVLDALDRWDARFQLHNIHQRAHVRTLFRSKISLRFNSCRVGETSEPNGIQVWTRDVSRGGVSFVHSHSLERDSVLIALGSRDGLPRWIHSKIVRSRQVHHGFWEFGVAFGESVLL